MDSLSLFYLLSTLTDSEFDAEEIKMRVKTERETGWDRKGDKKDKI